MEHAETIERAVAVYRCKRTGKRTAIMPVLFGGFYEYRLDYTGLFAAGATASLPDYIMRIIQDESSEGMVDWLKTPQTNYHVWHICYCPECRGKMWTHSQGDWDSHLRFADIAKVFTFPTVEKCEEVK